MKHLAGLTTGALALVAAFAGPVLADGMPTRRAPVVTAPPPPPAARCAPGPWTGFYVGGNLGWAHLNSEFNDHDRFFSDRRHFDDDEDAFTAGVQSGYNLQCGNVVFGFESDINWVDADDDNDHFGHKKWNEVTEKWEGPHRFNRDRSMDWFSTIRGRLGWTNDRGIMVYATAGAAFTQLDHGRRGRGLDHHEDPTISPGWSDFRNDSDDVQWGWTAGGGVEWLWSPNLSFKAEALFIDFEDDSDRRRIKFENEYGTKWHDTKRFDFDESMVVVRVGLNYKFGYRQPVPYEPLK